MVAIFLALWGLGAMFEFHPSMEYRWRQQRQDTAVCHGQQGILAGFYNYSD
ncbi:MAG: hypothetical protein MKZ95_16250 [Pirellulales bacterium]|nr:hypothetical protein [Pirellulales bacterium]